jgi:DNA repair photolyase
VVKIYQLTGKMFVNESIYMFLSTYFGSLWPENLDYQVDPYAGCRHYCYYCYVLNQAETDWTKEILIYNDITGQLSGELEKISPQKIYMGYYMRLNIAKPGLKRRFSQKTIPIGYSLGKIY